MSVILDCSHTCIGPGSVAEPMCCVVSLSFNIHFVPGPGRYRIGISPRRLYQVVQHEGNREDASNHLLPAVFSGHFVFLSEVVVDDHSTRLFTGSCRPEVIRRYLLSTL
jgi:hypothetical protein